MLLANEDTSVVHGLGKAQLEDESLQTALQEVLGGQREHIIQLVLGLLQQPILVHAPKQRLSLKQALRLLVVQRQQRPSSLLNASHTSQQPQQCSWVSQARSPTSCSTYDDMQRSENLPNGDEDMSH